MRRERGLGLPGWLIGWALMLGLAVTRVARAQETTPSSPAVGYTLSNGLRVILEEDHRQPLVAIRMSYAAGSGQDPNGRPGLAQTVQALTERHLSTSPTRPFVLLQHAGASDLTAFTSFDETYYSATVTRGALELALWVERDRLDSVMQFNDFQLRVEQSVLASPSRDETTGRTPVAPRALIAAVLGQEQLKPSATVDDARTFFAAGYRPDNAQLVLVGDFQTATARELVNRYFGSLRNPNVLRLSPPAARIDAKGKRLSLPSEDATNWLALTWPMRISSLRERAQQELVLELLNQVLERASRISEQDAAAMRPNVQLSPAGANALLVVRLPRGVSPGTLRDKLEAEFARLARGVAADELARVRHRVQVRWLAAWEYLSQRATLQASVSKITGRPITAQEYLSELEAVRESDLAALGRGFEPKDLAEVDWLLPGAKTANQP